MRFFILISFLLISLQQFAANTVISGTIRNGVAQEVILHVDRTYLDNTFVKEYSTLNENNQFSFELDVKTPQLFELEYQRNRITFYIDPGGHLDLDFDANLMKSQVKYSGSSGAANKFWADYKRLFWEESNPFKRKQLKKNIVYYGVDEALEDKMKRLGPINFSANLGEIRERKKAFKRNYEQNNGLLPQVFSNYIDAEIDYDWAYKMLIYGHSFQNLHEIPETFFNFIDEVALNNKNALGNKKYRDFVIALINFKHDKQGSEYSNPYIGQYHVSSAILQDIPLAFFQADILERGFRKTDFNELLPTYNAFIETVPYSEFYLKAVDAYFSKKPYAIGAQAPTFDMKDANGNLVVLSDYLGKVVIINFWASWCKPCINKVESMKTLKSWTSTKDIVFINVSLERSYDKFQEQVQSRGISDMINVFAEQGMESPIIKKYDVKAVPEFFIISKNGAFARKPQKTDPFTLKDYLKTML